MVHQAVNEDNIRVRGETVSMRQRATGLLAALTSAAIAISIHTASADVFTEPVGFYKVNQLTNSDTYVSVPFTQIPAARGAITSASGTAITAAGSPGWSVGQWATPTSPNNYYPYYVQVGPGAGTKEGAIYT